MRPSKKVVGSVGGLSASASAQWLMVVLVARTQGAAVLGIYALALAIATPIYLLSGLGLRLYIATRAELSRSTFARMQRTRTVTILSASLLGIVVAFGSAAIGYTDLSWMLLAALAWRSVEQIADLNYAVLQRARMMHLVGLSMAVRSYVGAVVFGAILVAGASLPSALLGTVAVWVATTILLDGRWARRVVEDLPRGQGELNTVLDVVRRCLPLGATAATQSLATHAPKYAIAFVLGEAAVGVYTAVIQFVTLGSIVINGLAQLRAPDLGAAAVSTGNAIAQSLQEALRPLRRTAGGMGLLAILISLLAGRQVLALVYGQSFQGYTTALTLAMIAGAFAYLSTPEGYAMVALGRMTEQLWASSSATLVGVILVGVGAWIAGIEGSVAGFALGRLLQLTLYRKAVSKASRIL